MEHQKEREEIIRTLIRCRETGLLHGTSGNASIAIREEDIALVYPSNIPYDELKPEDIATVRLSDGEWIAGNLKPSSETIMHVSILRAKPKMSAVLHTHSLFSTVIGLCMDELPAVAVASCPYSPVRVAPFEIAGSKELAEAAVNAMGDDNVACLLQYHGLIASGPTMSRAFSITEYIEENARTAYYLLTTGKMKAIPYDAYKVMHDRAVKRMGLK